MSDVIQHLSVTGPNALLALCLIVFVVVGGAIIAKVIDAMIRLFSKIIGNHD